jgi:hypothetical protein
VDLCTSCTPVLIAAGSVRKAVSRLVGDIASFVCDLTAVRTTGLTIESWHYSTYTVPVSEFQQPCRQVTFIVSLVADITYANLFSFNEVSSSLPRTRPQ